MKAHGHCLCGNVEFEANGTPSWVAYCHCASCRRHTGSPVTCFVNFARGDVDFRREPSVFESSPGVRRSFCERCGTPIAYETEKRANEIDIYLNAFDEPEAFSPETHVFHSERIPWFDTRDELPRKG